MNVVHIVSLGKVEIPIPAAERIAVHFFKRENVIEFVAGINVSCVFAVVRRVVALEINYIVIVFNVFSRRELSEYRYFVPALAGNARGERLAVIFRTLLKSFDRSFERAVRIRHGIYDHPVFGSGIVLRGNDKSATRDVAAVEVRYFAVKRYRRIGACEHVASVKRYGRSAVDRSGHFYTHFGPESVKYFNSERKFCVCVEQRAPRFRFRETVSHVCGIEYVVHRRFRFIAPERAVVRAYSSGRQYNDAGVVSRVRHVYFAHADDALVDVPDYDALTVDRNVVEHRFVRCVSVFNEIIFLRIFGTDADYVVLALFALA